MPIYNLPDWEQRLARQDAFWDCAVIDRPVVAMTFPKAQPVHPWPPDKPYASYRERWMDTERVVDQAVAGASNTLYYGDALPMAWPNLGPEVFSAFFGLDMEYGADTSWAIPNLSDWSEAHKLSRSAENYYWKKLVEMTTALLDAGKGLYYVGLTDLHPGGDAVAAFRDPMVLNTDLFLFPNQVKRLLARIADVFLEVYDFFYEWLTDAGQPVATWPGIVSSRKWHVPSNDFSCMISREMFNEFFLPGIIEECKHMDANIYHLDGPGALRHLDTLLAVPEINAIQWVYGAGNGRATDWLGVYQKCQSAGKGVQLSTGLDELDCIIENLKPEGIWLNVDVDEAEQARYVLKKAEKWT